MPQVPSTAEQRSTMRTSVSGSCDEHARPGYRDLLGAKMTRRVVRDHAEAPLEIAVQLLLACAARRGTPSDRALPRRPRRPPVCRGRAATPSSWCSRKWDPGTTTLERRAAREAGAPTRCAAIFFLAAANVTAVEVRHAAAGELVRHVRPSSRSSPAPARRRGAPRGNCTRRSRSETARPRRRSPPLPAARARRASARTARSPAAAAGTPR